MKALQVMCPHCGIELSGDESMQGLVTDCPSCSKSFTVPAMPAVAMVARPQDTWRSDAPRGPTVLLRVLASIIAIRAVVGIVFFVLGLIETGGRLNINGMAGAIFFISLLLLILLFLSGLLLAIGRIAGAYMLTVFFILETLGAIFITIGLSGYSGDMSEKIMFALTWFWVVFDLIVLVMAGVQTKRIKAGQETALNTYLR